MFLQILYILNQNLPFCKTTIGFSIILFGWGKKNKIMLIILNKLRCLPVIQNKHVFPSVIVWAIPPRPEWKFLKAQRPPHCWCPNRLLSIYEYCGLSETHLHTFFFARSESKVQTNSCTTTSHPFPLVGRHGAPRGFMSWWMCMACGLGLGNKKVWHDLFSKKQNFQNCLAYFVGPARAHMGLNWPIWVPMGLYGPIWQKTLVRLM